MSNIDIHRQQCYLRLNVDGAIDRIEASEIALVAMQRALGPGPAPSGGCWVERAVADGSFDLLFDEEGALRDKPSNPFAPAFVGPILVVGLKKDDDGSTDWRPLTALEADEFTQAAREGFTP